MSLPVEIFDSLKESTKERIGNPFFGAFMFSWVIFNWKLVLILIFSKKEIEVVLENLKLSGLSSDYISLIASPLIAASLYVYFGPIIMNCIFRLRSKSILELKLNKFNHETRVLRNKSILSEAEDEIVFRRRERELKLKEKEYDLEDKRNSKIIKSEKEAIEQLKKERDEAILRAEKAEEWKNIGESELGR